MELRVLSYFLMVAREENITRAAQLLHVTQPTLSRQLMQLEQELGVRLFTRSSHHIVLTDEGMLLRRRAQELVSLAEKTRRELRRDEQLSGEISIGSGEFHSFSLLATLLASFRRQYPLVRFDLYSGNADNIKDRIERGTLDIGLLSDPVDIGKYEFVRLPQKEVWGILAPADSPLGQKEQIAPADLAGQRLMVSQRALVQNALASWLGELQQQVEITTTYNLLYNVAMMVQQGMGVALCLELDCHYEGLRFMPLWPRWESGTVLVWKKNQALSPTFDAFLRHVKLCLSGISGDNL
ncbi:Hca operon transcriptional activator [Anaerotruncus sp. 2789STDY5834896]|uniref:Hca operon transcriptional activator n=1 Tax=uncultured Anaerotruncus sp. TaxID=905011 RepID=A0A1C6HE41_9FIRM|nr:Hca operon transcriptional activator [uncultured Anaerotruncus sp.]